MKKNVIVLLIFVLFVPDLMLAQDVSVFNGENFDGWKKYGEGQWYVENGELIGERNSGKDNSYLVSEESYKDFDLTLEFFLSVEGGGNSGIFFRSLFEGSKVIGWQVEVEPEGNNTGGIYEYCENKGWLITPEISKRAVQKRDMWNKMKIIVVGDSVTTWLNGTKMVTLIDVEIGKANGQIAFQLHGGGNIKIRYKNIKIKKLK